MLRGVMGVLLIGVGVYADGSEGYMLIEVRRIC